MEKEKSRLFFVPILTSSLEVRIAAAARRHGLPAFGARARRPRGVVRQRRAARVPGLPAPGRGGPRPGEISTNFDVRACEEPLTFTRRVPKPTFAIKHYYSTEK